MPGKVVTRSESRAQRALDSAPYENTRSRRQASLANYSVSYRTGTSCPPLTAFLETCRPFYSGTFGPFTTSGCRQIACNPISGHVSTVPCDIIYPVASASAYKTDQAAPKLPILSDARCRPFLTTNSSADPSYTRFQEICAMATFKPFTPMTPPFNPTLPADIVPTNDTMSGSTNGTMTQDLLQGSAIIFGTVAAGSVIGMSLGAVVATVYRYFRPQPDPTVTPAPRLEEQTVIANEQETTLTTQPATKGNK